MDQLELSLVTSTYDNYGTEYAKRRFQGCLLFNDYIEAPIIRGILSRHKTLRGTKCLDIGCGPGVYSKLLLGSGAELTGIDASSVMLAATVEHCADLTAPRSANAKFIHGDFLNHSFGLEEFDIVLATFMLGYFDDLALAFTRMRNHLAKGGQIIASSLHPIRTSSTRRDSAGYYVENYLSPGYYLADFLGETAVIPLRKHSFDDVRRAALIAGLRVVEIFEPKPQPDCGYPDSVKIDFYVRNPSIAIFVLQAR